jgi:hypothetical protein
MPLLERCEHTFPDCNDACNYDGDRHTTILHLNARTPGPGREVAIIHDAWFMLVACRLLLSTNTGEVA